MKFTPLIFLALLFAACTGDPAPVEMAEETPAAPYAERVAKAEQRLMNSSAGQRVLAAINAHGGLENWYANSPLEYHFNYRPEPGEQGSVRNTLILNDYVNARAVHKTMEPAGMSFGFDGQDAWKGGPDEESGMSPRFWSLTPYYFVGLPFVLADEGINFEELAPTELDGTEYTPIKVTYAAGTGDADQDYYVLYLDPATNQLRALNYIVSYPGFFEEGTHLPEKLMRIKGYEVVDGIALPTGYSTYWSDAPDKKITDISVSDYAFKPATPATAFDKPAGAVVVTDLPGAE